MTNRLFCSLIMAAICTLSAHSQNSVTYPHVETLSLSADFTAVVNGKTVPVEEIGPGGMENLNIIHFSCKGRQSVTISTSQTIKNWSVEPKPSDVSVKAEGNTLTLEFDGPQNLYVGINDRPYIAVFANPMEGNVPEKGTEGVDFYANGFHDVGKIVLHDNQTIYIAGGAAVKANVSGTAKNVKIIGRGFLLGNLSVRDCENLQVEGIIMSNTRGWTNTVTNSVNTSYSNVKVFSHTGVWGLDGINPVSCKGFTIDGCFIRTRDDCIAVKSDGRDSTYDLSSRDILVKNSLLIGWDHADGVTLGFELNGGDVENVTVTDCCILRAKGSGRTGGHAAFSIVCDGASNVHDITFRNIRVASDIEYKNVEIILTEAERYGNGKMGSINGVLLENIYWENPLRPFTIVGHPTRFVENVTFSNCYAGGRLLTGIDDAQFQIEYVRGLSFTPGGAAKTDRYPLEESRGRVAGQRRTPAGGGDATAASSK